jgi:hypothetical protein
VLTNPATSAFWVPSSSATFRHHARGICSLIFPSLIKTGRVLYSISLFCVLTWPPMTFYTGQPLLEEHETSYSLGARTTIEQY